MSLKIFFFCSSNSSFERLPAWYRSPRSWSWFKSCVLLYVVMAEKKLEKNQKIIFYKPVSVCYIERTRLKHVKIMDLFPGYSSTARHFISINKHRMAFRRSLVKATNRRRHGTLSSVWTLDGKVNVRSSLDGSPIRIIMTCRSTQRVDTLHHRLSALFQMNKRKEFQYDIKKHN